MQKSSTKSNNSLKKGSLPEFYSQLNAKQALAVNTIKGPLLILAGPGTGKTQLLSVRAHNILSTDTNTLPENILILTYTNAATKAMKDRLAKIIGPAGYDIEVGTFHSFANSIIQESEEAANYAGNKIQMSDVERVRAIEYILDHADGVGEIRPFGAPYLYASEIIQKIGELKKDGISCDDLDAFLGRQSKDGSCLEEKHLKRLKGLGVVYRMYEQIKEGKNKDIFDDRGRYDYDDMIMFATEALKKEKSLRRQYQKQYSYVMVDEFQDTNGAQMELLFAMLDYGSPNLCCVGDDDQSIYRFQGASIANFRLFKERFPELKEISLKDNYRSSGELIRLSRSIIELIPRDERMAQKSLENIMQYRDREIEFREFSSQEEELLYIVDKVRELKERIMNSGDLGPDEKKSPYNNIAILVRKRDHILKIIDAFLRSGIPYATDGKEDISGEKRVKQLLDVLELAHIDPKNAAEKDLALFKILSSDYAGIEPAALFKFISQTEKKRRGGGSATLMSEFFGCFKSNPLHSAVRNLLEDAPAKTVHTLLLNYIKETGLFKHVLREYAGNDILRIRELRSITSFVNMIKEIDLARPGIRLGDFMLELKTRKEHGLPVQGRLVTASQDGVRIYTAHGSKGLEFHSVIIPFCLQNKNWPARPIPEKLPLPPDLFKTKERVKEKSVMRQLALYDETRLFYVAVTRSKSTLVFTASPTENAISSSYLNNPDIPKNERDYAQEEELMHKSIDITDLEDPLIGTEKVLKDMVGNMSLNPTRVNTYLFCRRKFLYNDVLKLPGPKKKSLVFGNCVHKALEEVYTKLKNEKRFPHFTFFLSEFRKELKAQGVDSRMELDCVNKVNSASIKDWYDHARSRAKIPVGLEKKLIITVGDNIIFTGKYDKVEWEDEKKGHVRIIDYKTGKPDLHIKKILECPDLASGDCDGYLRQLVSYRLLYEKDRVESRGRLAKRGVLVFVEPVSRDIKPAGLRKGDFADYAVDISDEMVGRMEDIIKDVWRDIQHLRFEKLQERDKDKCGKCDYDEICWRK